MCARDTVADARLHSDATLDVAGRARAITSDDADDSDAAADSVGAQQSSEGRLVFWCIAERAKNAFVVVG